MIPYLTLAKAGAAVAVVAGAYWSGSSNTRDRLTTEHALTVQRMVTEAQSKVIAAQGETIATHKEWASRLEGAQREQQKERDTHGRMVAGLSGALGGVRSDIAAYAAGRGATASDTVAACRADAAALGGLLDRALQLAFKRTADAESIATDLRAVLGAWPVTKD